MAVSALGTMKTLAGYPLSEVGGGPVNDVSHGVQTQGLKQLRGQKPSLSADQAIRAGQRQQHLVPELVVVALQKVDPAGVLVVGPGHRHEMQCPLGRPGGVVNQVLEGMTGKLVFAVHAVMAQLVDIRVGLVGNALSVTIHVDAEK